MLRRGVFQRDEWLALRRRDQIIEGAGPSHAAAA